MDFCAALTDLITSSYELKVVSTFIGFCGSFLFAFCNVPSIMKIYQRRSADDISYGYIVMSIVANMCCAEFVFYGNLVNNSWQVPLYFNYGIAWVCCIWMFLLKRKFSNRSNHDKSKIINLEKDDCQAKGKDSQENPDADLDPGYGR